METAILYVLVSFVVSGILLAWLFQRLPPRWKWITIVVGAVVWGSIGVIFGRAVGIPIQGIVSLTLILVLNAVIAFVIVRAINRGTKKAAK